MGCGCVKRVLTASWQSEVCYCTGLVFQLYVMVKGISVILSFGFHGAMLLSVVKETPGFPPPPLLINVCIFVSIATKEP